MNQSDLEAVARVFQKHCDALQSKFQAIVKALPAPEAGPPGVAGPAGESIQGNEGPPGARGDRGRRGRDGRDAKDGTDGRDAASIDILPDFDPEKSYPVGTFASHDGGLFRHNGARWVCLVDGFKGLELEIVSDRTIEVRIMRTSGITDVKKFELPALIYRGIWDKDKAYSAGDSVTQNGSMWVCLRDTSSRPGTDKDAWRLAVKRGLNGKSVAAP